MRHYARSCLLVACAALAPFATVRAGVVWTVTQADDLPNPICSSADRCTLRGAVAVARNGDTVFFSPALGERVVIELQEPLVVDKDIEIGGFLGISDGVTLRPAGLFRPVIIQPDPTLMSARVMLTDLTIRDGTAMGTTGISGSTPGAHGLAGSTARGGCLLVNGSGGAASAYLTRVALRHCTALGGDGGHGAAGADAERGAGGGGGTGGRGGDALGGAIAVTGHAQLHMVQSSVSESTAQAGRGGDGGRGGNGSLAGGTGGHGGSGGMALGGAIYVDSGQIPASAYLRDSSLLANALGGGDGGARGAGGRAGGFAGNGAPGQSGAAGNLGGGNLVSYVSASLELVQATLGPAVVVRGNPGNWDGTSDVGRSQVQGESVYSGKWRVRGSVLVGTSPHPLCGGLRPDTWQWSGTSAASDSQCLQDESLHASVEAFAQGMAPRLERGRAVAIPAQNARLVDALPPALCGSSIDQSGRNRPLDGDGDGEARCDLGAVEVESSPLLFGNGFEAGPG